MFLNNNLTNAIEFIHILFYLTTMQTIHFATSTRGSIPIYIHICKITNFVSYIFTFA